MPEELFAKGKRGLIYTKTLNGKKVAIKRKNPRSEAEGRMENEGAMIELLNRHGIGPKLVSRTKDEVVYEFVEGKPIIEFIEMAKPKEALRVIKEVLYQCRTMDKLGISKEEMTRPVKHILVTKKGPVMIDFERAHKTKKPHNVTQFVQFLTTKKMTALLRSKGIFINIKKARESSAEYKKNPTEKNFSRIVSLLSLMTEFQTKVLLKTAEIPKGKVSTYSDIAEAIGTNAVRAVGTVLRKNPCPPEIPCHRVVKSDGTLGMYSGEKTKKEMLEQEGIKISDDGKVTRFQEKRHRF